MSTSTPPHLHTSTLGLFGGSFNPPHVGHLAVAEAAAEAAGLGRVVWMPANTPPHKRSGHILAAPEHRLAMTRLAAEGNARFEVSEVEVRRAGVSFTVDTLRALRAAHPEADLALVLGGDSLAGFATWREPAAILRLARLVVYRRPGSDEAGVPDEVLARTTFVDAPPLDLSSTAIRARIAGGKTVRYLVPDAVRAYVAGHGLYRAGIGVRSSDIE